MAVFAAFALLDPQQHALGVDIADLERDDLGQQQHAQAQALPARQLDAAGAASRNRRGR